MFFTQFLASWKRQGVMVKGDFSGRRPATSGVPQGSVLDPLLCVIFINDLDENVEGMISKFANDAQMAGIVDNEDGYQKIQQDLFGWASGLRSDKWSLMQICTRGQTRAGPS